MTLIINATRFISSLYGKTIEESATIDMLIDHICDLTLGLVEIAYNPDFVSLE